MSEYNSLYHDLIVAMYRDDLSYLQIAVLLGSDHGIKLSRNAVAGYINRARARGMELPDRRNEIQISRQRARFEKAKALAEKRARKRPKPKDKPLPPLDMYTGPRGGDAILARSETACCWPIGDPRQPDFRFCCEPANGRYCETHSALAKGVRGPRRRIGEPVVTRRLTGLSFRSGV